MTALQEVILTSDASGQMWNVCVWDPLTCVSLLTYKGGTTSPHGLAILNNDYVLSAINMKPILHIWPLHKKDNNFTRMVCPGKITALTVTPDGTYCIAAVSEKIHIWQVCTGHLLAILSRHYQTVTCLQCCSDGSFLVSAGEDNLVIVWSLPSVLSESGDQRSRQEPTHIFSQHSLPVTGIHVGFGGCQARVVSSSLDQTCKLWDIVSGELLCSFLFDVSITSVTMDIIESYIFAGGINGTIYTIKLFECPVRTERHIPDDQEEGGVTHFTGHSKQVTSLCVSVDGSKLISGSHDCSVKIWDIYSGQCTSTLMHKGAITNVLIIPAPPGITKDYKKPLTSLQTFQRHLHVEGETKDSGDSSNSFKIYQKSLEKDFRSGLQQSFCMEEDKPFIQELSSPNTEQSKASELKAELDSVISVNKELYEFALTHILQTDK